jgi:polyisoprenoid-binding protein YceI
VTNPRSLNGGSTRWLVAALLVLLGACRTLPTSGPHGAAPAAAPVPGSVLYSVDNGASQVLLRVYREGPMASLGHNHIIAVRELHGSVQLHDEITRSSFDLQFPVAELSVDELALRAAAGPDFSSIVSDDARQGTRTNMLGEKLLQAASNPVITLKSERITTAGSGWLVSTRISLRGQETLIDIPLQLLKDGDALSVSGEFAVLQTALGLTPYSALFGALRVSDEIKVRFSIVARRVRL